MSRVRLSSLAILLVFVQFIPQAHGLVAESNGQPSLLYPRSWFVAGDTQKQTAVFASCDSLWEIACFYIDTLVGEGWDRVGDLSFFDVSNEGYDWGGIFRRGGVVFKLTCYGPWQVGVLSEGGKPDAVSPFVEHRITFQMICGSIEDVLPTGFRDKRYDAQALNEYLQSRAEAAPNTKEAFYSAGTFREVREMRDRIRAYEAEKRVWSPKSPGGESPDSGISR